MINAITYLKFAKDIEPSIFENKTPQFHIDLINFINNPSHLKAAAVFRGAAKTTLLNKIYIISQIYFKQEPFTLIASSIEDKAISFLDAIKDIIDKAAAKGYAISRGKIWTKKQIEVVVNAGLKDENGVSLERTCYVVSISVGQDPRGLNIKNIRPTLIICDDLESKVGAYAVTSAANRKKLRGWFYADLYPAMHSTQGRLVIIGTIIHDDSILNNIINKKQESENLDQALEWDTIKIPIIQSGKSVWASKFSLEKIAKIKTTLDNAGLSNEFYQEYMCAAIDPQKAIFKREYFRYFSGVEHDLQSPFISVNVSDGVNTKELKIRKAKYIIFEGEKIDISKCYRYTTIDLASSSGRDETAIVTFIIDEKNRIFVADITNGHWTPFEKSVQIMRIFLTFDMQRIGIEKAGMQNDFFYTIDVISKLTGVYLPIEPLLHAGRAKNIRISNLEPYYRTGQIYHNSEQSTTQELEAQLIAFDPEVESKIDDIIDAFAYMTQFVVGRFFDDYDENFDEFESDNFGEWV